MAVSTQYTIWTPEMDSTSSRSGITTPAMDGTYLLAASVQPLPVPVQAPGPANDDASMPLSLRRTSGCCPARGNPLQLPGPASPGWILATLTMRMLGAQKTRLVVAGHEEMISAMSLSMAFTQLQGVVAWSTLSVQLQYVWKELTSNSGYGLALLRDLHGSGMRHPGDEAL